ncbi:hypothetical protein [Cystobacter fuscus]|nr:hypothetical protein [Cystobacter fuscus]
MRVVLVAAPVGAGPVEPLAPRSAPSPEGLSGEGLGDGVPRGVLRLVPEGGLGVEVGAGGAVGEVVVVVGGAVVAAIGSGLLVCLTASAAAAGEKTPIDIADRYYGTHFGDVKGWVQGRYSSLASPGAAPKPEPDKGDKKRLGRIYVTYRKRNRTTHRYYSGRTSMVVELTQSLELQAIAAVLLRDKNHHMDENTEPRDVVFEPARVDRFDVGIAVDYDQRYDDVAYWRIRGREQQLIDSLGGARSDTGEPYRTENVVCGVAKDNPRGRRFHTAATETWGLLHPYTGY